MKRAFSGAKQPMNNEKRGKIRPPNLFFYLILIPYSIGWGKITPNLVFPNELPKGLAS